MLEKFVTLLRKKLKAERNKTILHNGLSHAIPLERREAMVARAKALDWVEEQIAEILKLRESDVGDEDDEPDPSEADNADDAHPRRRTPQARGWGA